MSSLQLMPADEACNSAAFGHAASLPFGATLKIEVATSERRSVV